MTAFAMKDFFARVFALSAKHKDYYADFGYPETVTFAQLHRMYQRNDLAKAAVKKTTEKTFQNLPEIVRGEGDDKAEDAGIADALTRLGFWDKLTDVDEWAQVGGYAGIVLRIADGLRFYQPIEGPVDLDDLVEIIPCWSEQLKVNEWHTDETDADLYGKPKSFTFNESAITRDGSNRQGANRKVTVHPDRVFIWSPDGTVNCDSALLSGYNNLLDMEKVSGAGGEGFWKTAAQRLNIEIDKETDFRAFQQQVEEATGKPFQKALDEKAEKINRGFDSSYISQGMKVAPFSVSLPQPKEFFEIPLMAFAAPRMPMKILVGSQTGERASTEDAQEWNNQITARRLRWTVPSIRDLFRHFERLGIIEAGWSIQWDDLTDDTPAKRLERGHKMADINRIVGEDVYEPSEIRATTGHDDLSVE